MTAVNTIEFIGDELTLNDTYPILSDPTFIPDVTEELMKDREWKYKELKGCVLFAWGQLLRICASASPFSGTSYYIVLVISTSSGVEKEMFL